MTMRQRLNKSGRGQTMKNGGEKVRHKRKNCNNQCHLFLLWMCMCESFVPNHHGNPFVCPTKIDHLLYPQFLGFLLWTSNLPITQINPISSICQLLLMSVLPALNASLCCRHSASGKPGYGELSDRLAMGVGSVCWVLILSQDISSTLPPPFFSVRGRARSPRHDGPSMKDPSVTWRSLLLGS